MSAQRIGRLLVAIALGAGLLALPAAAALPLGVPAVEAASLPRWTGSVDVYRSGSFSTQKTYLWCTAADVQIARNIVHGQFDHSRSSQSHYFSWMRARNRYDIPVSDGVDPQGWAAGMRNFVDSRYRLATFRTYTAALRSAVMSLRLTNRPVGVLVARGGHAWLLTGFSATADPATTRNFSVTGVRVVGPLYGLQSRNGYDMAPDTRLSATAFKRFFTPWHYAGIRMVWEGLYGTVQATPANAAPTPALTPQAAIALHPPIPAPVRPMPLQQPPSSAAPAPAEPAERAAPTTPQTAGPAAPAGSSLPPPANGASTSILSMLAGLIVLVLLAAGAILGAGRARPAGQHRRSARRTSRPTDQSRPGSDFA